MREIETEDVVRTENVRSISTGSQRIATRVTAPGGADARQREIIKLRIKAPTADSRRISFAEVNERTKQESVAALVMRGRRIGRKEDAIQCTARELDSC